MYKNKLIETKQDITSFLIQKLNDYGTDDYHETEEISLDELFENTEEIIQELEDVQQLQPLVAKLHVLKRNDIDAVSFREQLSGVLIEALLII
jgi:hypothetical protein